jgi:hypothetical protein
MDFKMTRRLLGTALAVLTASVLVGAAPAATAATTTTFAGTVALSNCSGSIVKLAGAAETDRALVLSNGHCIEGGFPAAGEVIVNKPSRRTSPSFRGTATRPSVRCARPRSFTRR